MFTLKRVFVSTCAVAAVGASLLASPLPPEGEKKPDNTAVNKEAGKTAADQKETIRAHLQGSDVKCTSCHTLHTLDHAKHTSAPKSDLCFRCHESDFRLKEYQQSCAVCEF